MCGIILILKCCYTCFLKVGFCENGRVDTIKKDSMFQMSKSCAFLLRDSVIGRCSWRKRKEGRLGERPQRLCAYLLQEMLISGTQGCCGCCCELLLFSLCWKVLRRQHWRPSEWYLQKGKGSQCIQTKWFWILNILMKSVTWPVRLLFKDPGITYIGPKVTQHLLGISTCWLEICNSQ